jgi:hypothetical protein
MLDLLQKHLTAHEHQGCIAADWIKQLDVKEQEAFKSIKQNNHEIKIAQLYKDLNEQVGLPFKLTAFRAHLRGYCICR